MDLNYSETFELRVAIMNLFEECKKLEKNILKLSDLIHNHYDVPEKSNVLHGHKYNLEKGTLIRRLRNEE